MHFTKTIFAFFAVAGFAAAHFGDLERREAFEIARGNYLVTHDEYIEQRDLYLRKQEVLYDGNCNFADYNSKKLTFLRKSAVCGTCSKKGDKPMSLCKCKCK
ncbi:unnamed protein product [Clonostachys rosea]|uniref:Uncharacterized protein n=1 Tax=Bionectria ochroleuca TaxID=29856 RepID=A0ABY6UPR3_BIOOC|nr:unnamed protein product [Clonostachys rosea]